MPLADMNTPHFSNSWVFSSANSQPVRSKILYHAGAVNVKWRKKRAQIQRSIVCVSFKCSSKKGLGIPNCGAETAQLRSQILPKVKHSGAFCFVQDIPSRTEQILGNIYLFGTNSDFFGIARVQKNKTAARYNSRQGRRLCPQCSKVERTVLHTGFSRVQNRYWVPLPVTHEQDKNQLFLIS